MNNRLSPFPQGGTNGKFSLPVLLLSVEGAERRAGHEELTSVSVLSSVAGIVCMGKQKGREEKR